MQHADQISIKNGESLGVKKGNVVSMHICGIQCLPYGVVNHLDVSNYSMFTWLIGSYIKITLHCEFYNMEFHYWMYISRGTVKMASSRCLYLRFYGTLEWKEWGIRIAVRSNGLSPKSNSAATMQNWFMLAATEICTYSYCVTLFW